MFIVEKCSTTNMWEFHCGVCDMSCQSVSLLERHNICPKHTAKLQKLNRFPRLESYDFTLLQFSWPSQKISKESKCLKIICFYNIYIFKLHNFFSYLWNLHWASYSLFDIYSFEIFFLMFCTTDLPRLFKDNRFWCIVCGTYIHTFEGLQVHNKKKKYCQQLLDLGLPNEHGDLDYNMDYSKVTFI